MTNPKIILGIFSKDNNYEKCISVEDITPWESYYICPMCGYKGEEDENIDLVYDDYVTHMMLWASNCCDAMCLLLENTFRKLTLAEAQKEFPEHSQTFQNWVYPKTKNVKIKKTKKVLKKRKYPSKVHKSKVNNFKQDQWYECSVFDSEAESEYEDKPIKEPVKFFITFELAKIKRISNYQMYEYKLTKNISDDDIRRFIKTDIRREKIIRSGDTDTEKKEKERWNRIEIPKIIEQRKKLMAELGIDEKEDNTSIDDIFKLSLPVNSYNVTDPEVPYPDNMDMSHDGISIFILCEDENGKEFPSNYWGD